MPLRMPLNLARECGMNPILGGGWWFADDAHLDAFAERIRAKAQLSGISGQLDLPAKALQAVQESVATVVIEYEGGHQSHTADFVDASLPDGTKLYAAPQPANRKPMTLQQIDELTQSISSYSGSYEEAIVRATELHHIITAKK